MKLKIRTTERLFATKDKKKYEKIGFEFKKLKGKKLQVHELTSKQNTISIDTLEDLFKLQDKFGDIIITRSLDLEDDSYELEIYNDYRE